VFEEAPEKASEAASAVIISQVVLLGDLEGNPVTASNIADELSLPRTTVRTKLALLVKLGHIEKTRWCTYVTTEKFRVMPLDRAKKFRKIVERALEGILPALHRRTRAAA
jgi:hypothetical protein